MVTFFLQMKLGVMCMIVQGYKIQTYASCFLGNVCGTLAAVRVGAMNMKVTYIFEGGFLSHLALIPAQCP
jgi:hypothetical protein